MHPVKQDYKKILDLVREVAATDEPITRFEADFLAELARMARFFKEDFTLTLKQVETLQEIEDRYLLKHRLNKKVRAKSRADRKEKPNA